MHQIAAFNDSGDGQPDTVMLESVKSSNEVEDSTHDQEQSQDHANNVQRTVPVNRQDDSQNKGDHPSQELELPRDR